MSSIFKTIYRYTRPRTYRHNENLWPYMKIRRAITGEITSLKYRGGNVPIVDLSSLRDKFSGPIMLAATGPSINEINFTQHPLIPSMGVNGAWHVNQFLSFSFYVIVDMGFFDNRPDVVSQVVADSELTLFTTAHGIARIINKIGIKNIRCSLALIEDAAFKIYQPSLKAVELKNNYHNQQNIYFLPNREEIGFATDIRNGIFDAGTVIYWALQIIAFLGYSEIYVLGLDMNNFDKPRFYEDNENKLPTNLEGMVDNIIFPALKHASNVFGNKVKVFNLSMSSSVPNETFQKASYDDIFVS